MSVREVLSSILTIAVLSVGTPASAQMSDQGAREQARKVVRLQRHLRPGQFLSVQRDEALERMLAAVVAQSSSWPGFIYRLSQEGDEIKEATKESPAGHEIRESTVVHHIVMDSDPMHIIAISSADGTIYRVHGFDHSESLAEFNKLLIESEATVSTPDQAELVAELYREVNPENHQDLASISSLIELKQAAERQCHSGLKSFDVGEKAFTAWWNRAKPLYAELPFQQRAVPRCHGYRVGWIVLSSPSRDNCGGVPLRATLEVATDGQVSKVTFAPPGESRKPSATTP